MKNHLPGRSTPLAVLTSRWQAPVFSRGLVLPAIGLLTALSLPAAHAQSRVTVSGTIKDAKTGEDLTGATVRIVELPGTGTGANATASTP